MLERYASDNMQAVFSEDARYIYWYVVELEILRAWKHEGLAPGEAVAALEAVSPDPKRIAQLEARQQHDVAAFVSSLQERMGQYGRFVHYGITSSDILDTALGIQLRDAGSLILRAIRSLEDVLRELSHRYRTTTVVGRTHGVHAELLPLGLRFANHFDEVHRARLRIERALKEVVVGKVRGAVGSYATVPPSIEEQVCRALRLELATGATQVIPRDRYASFISALGIFGGVAERLALTVRLSQQTELSEMAEPFGERQKGSSAMPHKRNPVRCERVCGLSRVLRGNCVVAFENIALWFERDISHSSAERLMFFESASIAEFIANELADILRGITVNVEEIERDISASFGVIYSQHLLLALMNEGKMGRDEAYDLVQRLSFRAARDEMMLWDIVDADAAVAQVLTKEQIERCFSLDLQQSVVDIAFQRMITEGTPEN